MTDKQRNFVECIARCVKKYAPAYGIKVHSPIIAQAILESGWGESKLAAQYHNYFGLKCGSKWTGKSVNMTTQEEYQPGTLTTIKDNFRAFDSMEDGVKGYFDFISYPRYANLKGVTDPETYLRNIKADGYATDSSYVDKLLRVIAQNSLTQYDKEGNTMSDRQKPIDYLKQYVGIKEGSAEHKAILKVFNDSGLCSRYTMTTKDAWCATGVSAAFIASGLADIFPCVECSCGKMVELAQKAGIWVENDAYVPKQGDVVMYDWDDNGVGDNTGWSDHVGIAATDAAGGSVKIIECNISDSVGYRTLLVNGKYIRGYITPKYSGSSSAATAPTPAAKKTVSQLAKEVLSGKWGNGTARKEALEKAGYDYNAVQAEINRIAKGGTATQAPKKSVDEVAREVISGKWGNGEDRRKKFTAAGYNPSEVQARVNALLKGGSAPSAANTVKAIHTVQRGDTTSAIAKKYGTTIAKVVAANKPKYPKITANYIQVGWKLTIL